MITLEGGVVVKMENEDLIRKLPKFKYHPNPLKTGAFIEEDEPFVCDCCGKETLICYSAPFYSVESILSRMYCQWRGSQKI